MTALSLAVMTVHHDPREIDRRACYVIAGGGLAMALREKSTLSY